MKQDGRQRKELFIIARFHAREGQEGAVAEALRSEVLSSRADPGCLSHEAYRSVRNPRLFFIESHWVDDAAFETHIGLPHTVQFAESIQLMIDHELEPIRLRPI
ncbi:MAG TPA: putative quinol monooxygenase [Nitrososphaerales archaeon]|nr:putative quinol monooxygenase [Nitrososphaerales archaeon]